MPVGVFTTEWTGFLSNEGYKLFLEGWTVVKLIHRVHRIDGFFRDET